MIAYGFHLPSPRDVLKDLKDKLKKQREKKKKQKEQDPTATTA